MLTYLLVQLGKRNAMILFGIDQDGISAIEHLLGTIELRKENGRRDRGLVQSH